MYKNTCGSREADDVQWSGPGKAAVSLNEKRLGEVDGEGGRLRKLVENDRAGRLSENKVEKEVTTVKEWQSLQMVNNVRELDYAAADSGLLWKRQPCFFFSFTWLQMCAETPAITEKRSDSARPISQQAGERKRSTAMVERLVRSQQQAV